MQLFLDFFPLLAFFVAYLLGGIYWATGAAIVGALAQFGWLRLRRQKIGVVHWLTLVLVVVFGGATLLLHDPVFIKMKPTVLYGLFALILLVGKVAFRRDLLRHVMTTIDLPDPVWTRLTWAWVGFLAFMAAANYGIATAFSERAWAMFKVWGATGLFLAFAMVQALFLARFVDDKAAK